MPRSSRARTGRRRRIETHARHDAAAPGRRAAAIDLAEEHEHQHGEHDPEDEAPALTRELGQDAPCDGGGLTQHRSAGPSAGTRGQRLEPVRDAAQREAHVADLTVVLRLIRRGENARRDRGCVRQRVQLIGELVFRDVLVVSTARQQHVLGDAGGTRRASCTRAALRNRRAASARPSHACLASRPIPPSGRAVRAG